MLPPHSRRAFLRRSLLLSAAATAGPLLHACSPRQNIAIPSLGFLSPGAYGFLDAMSETLLAGAGVKLDVARHIDALVGREEAWLKRQFKGAVWLLEYACVPRHHARFSRLGESRRLLVLQEYATSSFAPLRQGLQGIYNAVMFCHYTAPEAWEAIGYEGPWAGEQP
jgi:hypothetical protein